jgi:thioredoxin 1
VTENKFIQRLTKNNLPVVVDVWAAWCDPCKTIEPTLKKIGREYAGWVDVWKVNVNENQELRTKLNITGLPTLIVYKGGMEVTRCTGAASKMVLNQLFETALSGVVPTQPAYILREHLAHWMLTTSRIISLFEKQANDQNIHNITSSPNCENPAG